MITIKDFEKATGVRFNLSMSGKMEGVPCLSTSNLCNPYCAARKAIPGSICARCYADTTCKRYAALNANMARNTEILTTRLFTVEDMPTVNAIIFRLEAFGDLVNAIQYVNYFRLCKANPAISFALWTKNPGIVRQALRMESKPDNLVILLSSHMIGEKADSCKWEFVDKTFTVYRKTEMSPDMINCGSRECLTCRRCYSKTTDTEIREYLK